IRLLALGKHQASSSTASLNNDHTSQSASQEISKRPKRQQVTLEVPRQHPYATRQQVMRENLRIAQDVHQRRSRTRKGREVEKEISIQTRDKGKKVREIARSLFRACASLQGKISNNFLCPLEQPENLETDSLFFFYTDSEKYKKWEKPD